METTTIASQRETELILLAFLKRYNPEVYALWRHHPDYEEDVSSSSTDASAAHSSGDEWEDVAGEQAKTDMQSDDHNQKEDDDDTLIFYRRKHMDYLMDAKLANIPSGLQGLYPAQAWLAYWTLQAADVLGITAQLFARVPREAIVEKLLSCLSSVGQDDERRARVQREQQQQQQQQQNSNAASDTSPSFNTTAEQTHTARVHASATVFPRPCPADLSRPCISFAGGASQQLPHMATSYAACCALAILTTQDSTPSSAVHTTAVPLSHSVIAPALLRTLPRAAIKRWLLSVRNEDGSFRMHWGGESDVRASYCAAVVTRLLRLDEPDTFPRMSECDDDDDYGEEGSVQDGGVSNACDDVRDTPVLTTQTARFVSRCQTHEGGFACGAYASEAHGAYTQCGLASLMLMHATHMCDLASLRRWLAARQFAYEGGFNGRTNKLVDSCYCHWVGASHVLLRVAEAHTKATGHAHSQAILGAPETPLTAREVCLLHHAQLLDARAIVCQDEAAWDHEETRVLREADATDFFLDASDAVKRASIAKRRARTAVAKNFAPAMSEAMEAEEKADEAFYAAEVGDFYFNQRKMQQYVLACCQSKTKGGLMDKPDTAHDGYHTCYSLSGMSQAQNLHYASLLSSLPAKTSSSSACASSYLARALERGYVPRAKSAAQEQSQPNAEGSYGAVLGIRGTTTAASVSMLRSVNPIFNLHPKRVVSALSAFGPQTFV